METLTATRGKRKNGVWYFTCPLHYPNPRHFREPSNPMLAIDTLKAHMDDKHPGIKVRIKVTGDYVINTTYSATITVETGDLL